MKKARGPVVRHLPDFIDRESDAPKPEKKRRFIASRLDVGKPKTRTCPVPGHGDLRYEASLARWVCPQSACEFFLYAEHSGDSSLVIKAPVTAMLTCDRDGDYQVFLVAGSVFINISDTIGTQADINRYAKAAGTHLSLEIPAVHTQVT